ncbi:hypothetical protein [Geobacter sp. AOG2]|uniref:hypothetical protein n=1 Tax=Geobacter sp. AOG2 TaxID=1566347 RepID=UPI001CC37829|nr:hypothetical protein [Geobacter sp. AOG2]GFE61669.1 hypothetical protein AOG2_22560 [Geobacter sp. AOG2]
MKLLHLCILLSLVMLPSCSDLNRSYGLTTLTHNKTLENEFPIDNKLYYMSYDQSVCIAVITGKVKIDSNFEGYGGYQEFVDSTSTELISEYEKHLITISKYFQHHTFSLVDRQEVNMVLDEYEPNNLAFLPQELREKFATETTATHILMVNFSRNYDDRSHAIDVTERQLINVATGAVEAVDYLKVRNSISPL